MDRNAWMCVVVPALLAAAMSPVVDTMLTPWTGLAGLFFALGMAHVGSGQGPNLDRWACRGLVVGVSTLLLLLWPHEPLILVLLIMWLVGLVTMFRSMPGVQSNAWSMVGALGLTLLAVASGWVWARAKGATFGIEVMTQIVANILRLVGVDAWPDQDSLWVGTAGGNEIRLTPEALGLPYLLLWTIGVGGTMYWNGKLPSSRFWMGVLSFGGIALGTFIVKVLAVVEGYWSVEVLPFTVCQLFWLVPVGIGIGVWVHVDDVKTPMNAPVPSGFMLAMVVVTGFIMLSLTMPFVSKYQPVHILIDDGHGPWESTTVPVNTENYGRLTLYNYTLLAQWLRVHHKVDTTSADSALPKDLSSYQVLIVKTPARDFSTEEIENVRTFVAHGGGLLLIGDHTNLFGHTERLNALAAPYGLKFRIDATYPYPGWPPPYLHHPSGSFAVDQMLNGLGPFAMLTAASVTDHSVWGMPIIRATSLISEAADYSNINYFGPLQLSPDDRVAPLALAIAKPYGNGKVVAWGESTMWSSFSLFHPEYPELILRLIGYAGTESTHLYGQIGAILSLLVLVGLAVYLMKRAGTLLMIQAILLSVPLGGFLGTCFSFQPSWPDVSQRIPQTIRTLAVDFPHSKASLRIDPTRHALEEQDVYTAFYGWLGRMQVWPFPIKSWTNLQPSRPLLILNPVRHFTETEIRAIGDFVRMGGTLCVLDDGTRAADSTAPEVLTQFGLQYRFRDESESLYQPREGIERWLEAGVALSPLMLGLDTLGEAQPAMTPRLTMTNPRVSIAGGTPLMVTAAGSVVSARKAFGQGKVVVFTNSQTFHQLSFGDIWGGTEPGVVRQQRYHLEFDLIQELWARD